MVAGGDREIDLAGSVRADPAIDPLPLGNRLEPIIEPGNRLGAAEKKETALAQREVEQ